MTTPELYALAARHRIDVCAFPLPRCKSLAVRDAGGRCAVGLDPSLSGQAERVRMAHELGHCFTGGFYGGTVSPWLRAHCEHKADKWAITHLIPRAQLERARREGLREPWQLAERFALPEDFVIQAIAYYKDGGKL